MRSLAAFLALAFLRVGFSACEDDNANNTGDEDECEYTIRVGNSAFNGYYGAYGIEFAVNQINEMGGLKLGMNNVQYKLEYIQEGYERNNDNADDKVTHVANMNQLLNQDKVHFVVGSHPAFAPTDVKLTNEAKRIQMMCCVGPNPLYEKARDDYDWNGVFGIHTPPEKYPIAPLTEAALHGAKKVALMYREYNSGGAKNGFTTHVCEVANDYAIDPLEMTTKKYTIDFDTSDAEVRKIAREIAEWGPDAFIGCFVEGDRGDIVAEELDMTGTDIGLRFMTVLPAYAGWVEEVAGVAGHYVSTGGQWHHDAKGCGRWFEHLENPDADLYCGADYVRDANQYMTQDRDEVIPDFETNYISASGSVSLFTLIDAMKQAYAGVQHTPLDFENDSGRDMIIDALNRYSEKTFFGAMDFDEYQRNTAKEAVNSQWLPEDGDQQVFDDKVTHPIEMAQTKFVYPVPYQPAQYAGSGCNDESAENYDGGAGREDCEYELVVGAALFDEYQPSWGIEAAVDQLNALGGLTLGSNKIKYKVTYKHYSHAHAQKDTEDEHAEKVDEMLLETDFVVGTGPWYANQEVEKTNAAKRVNILCCTGPDPVFQTASEDDFNGAFGVHKPPENYPMDAITHAATNGAKRIALAYGDGNVFTKHVCEMNKKHAEDLGMDVVAFESFFTTTSQEEADEQDGTFENIAKNAIDRGAEVFIGCTFTWDAVALAKKLEARDPEYQQLGTVFFTVGPTQGLWLKEAGDAGKFVTTGGQWDKGYEACGDWFGQGWPGHSDSYCSSDWNKYVEEWVKAQDDDLIPADKRETYQSDYETASGAVALYTLMDALVSAYKNEVHKPKHFDQVKVRDSLRTYRGKTFFGTMEFNNIQRNVGKETVAAQYLPTQEDESEFDKYVVFPVDGRQRPFAYPIVDYTHPEFTPEVPENCPQCKTCSADAGTPAWAIVLIIILAVILLVTCVYVVYSQRY